MKICPKCQVNEREPGQGYCRGCRREYQRGRTKGGRDLRWADPRENLTADLDVTRCHCCLLAFFGTHAVEATEIGLCVKCLEEVRALLKIDLQKLARITKFIEHRELRHYYRKTGVVWEEALREPTLIFREINPLWQARTNGISDEELWRNV